ncbi:uncharacterized protein LOC142786442 isoform X2 [Rhipicephalus microplus]|uniref:uncharacterized protein LOC142786442 isoform X2 n=1 Tax=Rhipicephalus microplus TaxID=6941 RepID=UPI003F6C089C
MIRKAIFENSQSAAVVKHSRYTTKFVKHIAFDSSLCVFWHAHICMTACMVFIRLPLRLLHVSALFHLFFTRSGCSSKLSPKLKVPVLRFKMSMEPSSLDQKRVLQHASYRSAHFCLIRSTSVWQRCRQHMPHPTRNISSPKEALCKTTC